MEAIASCIYRKGLSFGQRSLDMFLDICESHLLAERSEPQCSEARSFYRVKIIGSGMSCLLCLR